MKTLCGTSPLLPGNYFDTKMCFVTCSVLGYDDHVVFSYEVGREGFVTALASRLGGFLFFGSIFPGKREKVELHSQ